VETLSREAEAVSTNAIILSAPPNNLRVFIPMTVPWLSSKGPPELPTFWRFSAEPGNGPIAADGIQLVNRVHTQEFWSKIREKDLRTRPIMASSHLSAWNARQQCLAGGENANGPPLYGNTVPPCVPPPARTT